MIAALGVSALFLTSYLVYHYNVGSVPFRKEGWIRGVYFPLLISHTVLAAVVLPVVLRTAFLAFREGFQITSASPAGPSRSGCMFRSRAWWFT